jgi:uncharacterized protein YgiM (DUF1202 family)
MKSRTTQSIYFRRHRSEKLLLTSLSLVLLTACVAPSPYEDELLSQPDASTDPNSAGATYPPQASPSASGAESPAASASQFAFPLTSCGDRTSEPSGTWYSVFIDGGNVDEIRSRYCGDAISTTREKSGTPTVQVASFTSYAKALSLAKAIGGVVEQTAQPAPNPGTYQGAQQPAPSNQPPGSHPPGHSSAQVGQTAYLSASDASAPINIRSSASTEAEVQATGFVGERVQIVNQVQGDDGYTWYEVRSESGAAGWVRGDLVAAQPPASSQPSAPSPDYAQPAQPAPQSPNSAQPPAQPPYTQPPNYSQPPYSQPPYAPQPAYPQQPYQRPYPSPYQPPYSQAPYQPPYQPPNQPPNQHPYPQPGTPSYGMNRTSALTARDPGAIINIREYASPNSRVRGIANPGEPVQIYGAAQGEDGYTWYQVGVGGAMGWVRSDLVAPN